MLNKTQIRFLRSHAHTLNPVVYIGIQGLTENVYREIEQALKSHELIKIKLGNLPDLQQQQMITAITSRLNAECIQKIGHLALFFRANKENPRYILP